MCTVLSSVSCPALQYFSTYLIQGTIFENKHYWTWNVCFGFCIQSFWNISHSEKNKKWFKQTDRKGPLLLSYFNESWIFSEEYPKSTQTPNLTKSLPLWADLFHATKEIERRTDMKKLMVAFQSFANALTKFSDNILDKIKTYTLSGIKILLFCKLWLLWGKVEKYSRADQATNARIAHANCMMDSLG